MAIVTSRYTMDKQDPKLRQWVGERADLLGAIRLPRTAFEGNAGTSVTTDLLFFRARGGELAELAATSGSPLYTIRGSTLGESCADLALEAVCEELEAHADDVNAHADAAAAHAAGPAQRTAQRLSSRRGVRGGCA